MIPLIPESAPFSKDQRSWLNGFLAGLLGVPSTGIVSVFNPSTTLIGQSVSPTVGEVEEDQPWHDSSLSLKERLQLAKGKSIQGRLMASMAQLDCGSCGYLCKTYAESIASGNEKDLSLCQPGGKETASKLKELFLAEVNGVTNFQKSQSTAIPATSVDFDKNNPFLAPLLNNQHLNGQGSAKDTRLIALDIRGSGIQYKCGDSLGVFPQNCFELIHQIIYLIGAHGGEIITLGDGKKVPLREALALYLDIESPSDDLLNLLFSCAEDGSKIEDLQRLVKGEVVAGIDENHGVIELLRFTCSGPLNPQSFVDTLKKIRPRLYSISSSPVMFPDQIQLTVGMVRYEYHGRKRKGVASTFLGERVRIHEPVRVFVQPSHGFALPENLDCPMIMVGPGTGIAPFRAFLQERQATKSKGENWLFFGDQHGKTDFLYEQELKEFQHLGVLTKLDTAFSRETEKKIYVQDRMMEHAKEIWEWLQNGACFYVCGDAIRMAKDVDLALKRIISEQGAMSPSEASKFVENLAKDKRYCRDVY